MCRDFARDIRFAWKLGTVHHIQGSDGKPTNKTGGWGSIVREVNLDGKPLLLKSWPLMSFADRAFGNTLEFLGAHGLRAVPMTARQRVRHNLHRTQELVSQGAVKVPACIEVDVKDVLVMERLVGFEALRAFRDRHEVTPSHKIEVFKVVARELRRMHDVGGYHGEPGAGNIMLRSNGGSESSLDVAFVDFDWRYQPFVPLADRQILDLRYFALQQAAKLSACGEASAREVVGELYCAYGSSPIFSRMNRFSKTGPSMFQESFGYFGVSLSRHRELQAISLEVVEKEKLVALRSLPNCK